MSNQSTPLTMNIISSPLNLNIISQPLTLNNMYCSEESNNIISQPLTLNNMYCSEESNNIISQPLTLNVISYQPPSDHLCYILKSAVSNRTYIGYTTNFTRRIRQHNGEIVGGAKRTRKWRPWYPICLIRGFYESSSALRFEYRLQHPHCKRKAGEDAITFTLQTLVNLINNGDGSVIKENKISWPVLNIKWFDSCYSIQHPRIINEYDTK